MLLKNERNMIVKYGKKLIDCDLTTGTGGNISIIDRNENLVAISPSGVNYHKTTSNDIVIVNLEGDIIEGERKPSSELNMHLEVYNNRSKINSVVHTHSIYATTIACLNEEIPPVHYMIAVAGNKVPCAKYASFGTRELAKNAINSLKEKYKATLLSNHGLLSIGKDIDEAFNIAEEIEFVSEIYCRTKNIGDPVILSDKEMDHMHESFKTYGQ